VKWVTAQDLERWASTLTSQSDISQLVSDLIRASAVDISSIRFPAGDSSQMHGWDGHLNSSGVPPYVPAGESGWEFGTGIDAEKKANKDYEGRLKKSEPIDKRNATFVFVTPRRWEEAEIWAKNKLQEGKWKDVRAYDAVTLEDWLYICHAVAARLARDLGIMPKVGVHPADQFWIEYSRQFKRILIPEVLLVDRAAQAEQILNDMRSNASIHVWQADSTEEVIAFAVAAIQTANPDVRRFIEDRTLIIDGEDTARQMEHLKHMILLLRPDAAPLAGRLSEHNVVIVPVGRDNPISGSATLLGQQTTSGLTSAFQGMGLNEEESRTLALSCGRSVTILARQFPSAIARPPQWAGKIELLPALLAGSWDSSLEHDQKAIAVLAGISDYFQYQKQILPYLRSQDSPLIKEGDVWQVRAPVDAFSNLAHLFGQEEFERLRVVATTVFSEDDPLLDLPEDQRPLFEIQGRRFKHSRWLRDGLVKTLRLIHLRHEALGLTNTGTRPDLFIDKLVLDIPGLAVDYRRIASLHDELLILMEASPRPLLSALEQMLEGDGRALAPIFQDRDPLFSRSPHTGLLWGLEALAWDPQYLAAASLVLAKLDRIDPGGKLNNRPLNSLREIFLPWHPSTNANLVQRFSALDQIIVKEPEVGWKLLIKLLPGTHEVSFPTAKPRYMEAGASERETLTYGIAAEGRHGIVERAISLAGEQSERWVQLIKQMSQFEPAQRIRAIDLLGRFGTQTDNDTRSVLWTALRSFVAHHMAFPTADWTMKAEDLKPFQRLVETFEPADPITRVVWLFNDWNPAIPQIAEYPYDLPDKTRVNTIRDLLKIGGPTLILELASAATHPELVGIAAGQIFSTVEEYASLVNVAMSGNDRLALFASVLSAEAERQNGRAWQDQIALWSQERSWSDLQLANLVINWQDNRATWDFVVTLGNEVNRIYWERKRPWAPRGLSAEDAEIAAKNYIDVGRASAAINAFALNVDNLSSETIMKMLDSAISELNASGNQVGSNFIFEIEQIFKTLERRDDVPIVEIAKREYAYLPLFEYGDQKLTLHRVMSEDPTFYASLIRDAFKPHNKEAPEPTEAQKHRARAAYQLLSEFTNIPGEHEGQIDSNALSAWVDAVRAIAKEDDRSEIADQFIGHVLAYAGADSDGAWPHRVVRDLIERMSSTHLETGIDTERFNMAGRPHARAFYGGGERERDIAEQFREWSKKAQAWPRTSDMLERIAKSWDHFGAIQDQRSRQDRMRDEA